MPDKVRRQFRAWLKLMGLTHESFAKKTGLKYDRVAKLACIKERRPQELAIKAICAVYPDCPLVVAYPCQDHPCRRRK